MSLLNLQHVQGVPTSSLAGALANINNFANFESDDEFGLFLQTKIHTVLGGLTVLQTSGAGVHNALHSFFADPSSQVDVGNPRTALHNTVFWSIHGEQSYTLLVKALTAASIVRLD